MVPEAHQHFVESLIEVLTQNNDYLALAAGGSWIGNQMDRFSDLDLVVVHQSESLSVAQRKALAESISDLLVSFTGEHVGEPRLLICLYDHPLLHVDLKFVQLADMANRVEDPVLLWQRDGALTTLLRNTQAHFPHPDLQWIEDRFWVWIHYATTKIGRGELFETLAFLAFIQQTVLGPLALMQRGSLPKGVRKLEMILPPSDVEAMQRTTASYNKRSCLEALHHTADYYRTLRKSLMTHQLELRERAEARVMDYLKEID